MPNSAYKHSGSIVWSWIVRELLVWELIVHGRASQTAQNSKAFLLIVSHISQAWNSVSRCGESKKMLWGLKSQGLSCQIGHSGQPCHCSPRGGIQSANLNNLIWDMWCCRVLKPGGCQANLHSYQLLQAPLAAFFSCWLKQISKPVWHKGHNCDSNVSLNSRIPEYWNFTFCFRL
jgi:hypothetical protein